MRRRWLPSFPNYASAYDVEEVTPAITEAEFMSRFVEPHKPCVIRGAAKHWPAVGKWSVESLRAEIGDISVGESGAGFALEPIAEYGKNVFWAKPGKMTLSEFLDEVVSDVHPYVQLHSETFETFHKVAGDLGGFDFINLEKRPARMYGERIFLSRAGYSDWHTHSGDETLTAQVCAPKEFLMLPPDNATWNAMFPMAERGVWRVAPVYWPNDFAALVPYRVVLQPGDVVYIPMHWWHAAEGTDDKLNVTVAKVFSTPVQWLSDLRLPNVRFSLRATARVCAAESLTRRSLVPLVGATALALFTVGGFPLSLARNRQVSWRNGFAAD